MNIIAKMELEAIKSEIAPDLLNNPKFMEKFEITCNEIEQASNEQQVDLSVSAKGEEVRISKAYHDPSLPVKNNSVIQQTLIALHHNSYGASMIVEKSVGKFADAKQYAELTSNSEERANLLGSGVTVQGYYIYESELYDPDGIRLTKTFYSDMSTLGTTRVGEVDDLKRQLLGRGHKPTFTYDSNILDFPLLCVDASIEHKKRFHSNLGIVNVTTSKSIGSNHSSNDIKSELYSVAPESPDEMAFYSTLIGTYPDNNTFVSRCPGLEGQSEDVVKKQAARDFLAGIPEATIRTTNPQVYQAVLRHAQAAVPTYTQEQPVAEFAGSQR